MEQTLEDLPLLSTEHYYFGFFTERWPWVSTHHAGSSKHCRHSVSEDTSRYFFAGNDYDRTAGVQRRL